MTIGYFLERLTWPQALEAFKNTSVAVLPIGSNEQHGQHLPTGTDWMVARELARRLGERSNVIVTPTLPVGYAKYHTVFPGSLSMREETLKNMLIDISEDLLKYGITHILVVNGHGGNKNSLRQCGEYLRQRCVPMAVTSWWEMAHVADPSLNMIGHADYIETSAMLAIDPGLVDWTVAKTHKNRDLTPSLKLDTLGVVHFKNGTLSINGVMTDVTETGDMLEIGESAATNYDIEPTIATRETGELILEKLADYLAEFVEEFRKVTFSAVGSVGPTAGLAKR
jgi:creatinine amidohydrolase